MYGQFHMIVKTIVILEKVLLLSMVTEKLPSH
nr:MAG TPA_asm: hypothetical protein [Caudoviricetes sp.]